MKTKEEILADAEREMLDDYCSAILILLWKGDEMRFNEIYRELQRKGTTLSKPTLSEHLKHLRKKNGNSQGWRCSKRILQASSEHKFVFRC